MARLRRETRRFKQRAISSLMLAIELFNRPHDCGRTESVLILAQHACEMLLKGAIYQQRGSIEERGAGISYNFARCLGVARSDLRIISQDEADTLSILDCLRDCAMHHLLDLPEQLLYLHTQAAVAVFDKILFEAYEDRLGNHLPNRVLPISTDPPSDLQLFLDSDFSQIRDLLSPRKRRVAEVRGRLRYHMIVESCLGGDPKQPSDASMRGVIRAVRLDRERGSLFPGMTTLRLQSEGRGPTLTVQFTRRSDAPPVLVVGEDDDRAPEAAIVREVNLLDRYSMGLKRLAELLKVSQPMTVAIVHHLRLREDNDSYREFRVGGTLHKRYSPKALEQLQQAAATLNLTDVWREYRAFVTSRKGR